MKQTIQYLFKPEQPVAPTLIRGIANGMDLTSLLTTSDLAAIETEWATVVGETPRAFSIPRGLGILYDTTSFPLLYYGRTDFKTYVSASRLADRGQSLPDRITCLLRISSVGCAVQLADGNFLIHQRPHNATHVPDKYDAGVAGLAHVQPDSTFDFTKTAREKFARELKIGEEHLTDMHLTSVHSGSAPDYSGMVDFQVRLPFAFGQLQEKANPEYIKGMTLVSPADLPDYLLTAFIESEELIADGGAGLLSSLSHQTFLETVERMNRLEQRVFFGKLEQGRFIEGFLS